MFADLTDPSCPNGRVVLAVEVSVAVNMCWIQLLIFSKMVSLHVGLGTRTPKGPLFAVAMSQCIEQVSGGHWELMRSDGLPKLSSSRSCCSRGPEASFKSQQWRLRWSLNGRASSPRVSPSQPTAFNLYNSHFSDLCSAFKGSLVNQPQ